MTIGTDISAVVCRQEGYLQMTFNKRKLMLGKKLDREYECTFKVTYPAYILENKGYTIHDGRCWNDEGRPTMWPAMWESTFSANEVWDMYLDNKSDIDSYIGGSHEEFPETPHQLLHLASDVSGYSNIMDTGHGDTI